jgi:hypothetical protein
MHAMLGLAAADLVTRDPSLEEVAIAYRLKAIKTMKKVMSDPFGSDMFRNENALIATCFTLTFQSAFLQDGFVEFMTFFRGIVIVATQMKIKGTSFVFSNLDQHAQLTFMHPHLENMAPIPDEWITQALSGVEGLGPLCQHVVEQKYYSVLLDLTMALKSSPFLGV